MVPLCPIGVITSYTKLQDKAFKGPKGLEISNFCQILRSTVTEGREQGSIYFCDCVFHGHMVVVFNEVNQACMY